MKTELLHIATLIPRRASGQFLEGQPKSYNFSVDAVHDVIARTAEH